MKSNKIVFQAHTLKLCSKTFFLIIFVEIQNCHEEIINTIFYAYVFGLDHPNRS